MVRIVETSVRDGHQSLFATRMTTEEVVALCRCFDNAGYHAVEVWGGATFDACMRFLNEDQADLIINHINDNNVHITSEERMR